MKQNLRTLFLFSFLMLTIQLVFAQEKEITGTVTMQADGIPLGGVNVLVEGTANGTQTDFEGNYSLTASVGDVLNFSYLGMTTAQVTVGDSSTINVQLVEDAEQLGVSFRFKLLDIMSTCKLLSTYTRGDHKICGKVLSFLYL